MKNLFYLLVTFAIILSSCSSDDEATNPKVDIDGAKYTVNLNVSGFKLTEKSLTKSEINVGDYYLQYVFYHEDGSVYETDREKIDHPNAKNIVLNKEVPAGKYHVALLIRIVPDFEGWIPSIFTPVDLDTDLVFTVNTYYQLTTIDVAPAGVSLDIVLEAMWSTLEIKISDAATCYIPNETDLISCILTQNGERFYAKNKEPRIGPEWPHQWMSLRPILLEDFKQLTGFPRMIIGPANDTSVEIKFHGTSSTESNPSGLIYTRTLYSGKLERGKHYTLEGEIGTPNAESGIKISVTDFEDITLPFD